MTDYYPRDYREWTEREADYARRQSAIEARREHCREPVAMCSPLDDRFSEFVAYMVRDHCWTTDTIVECLRTPWRWDNEFAEWVKGLSNSLRR